jgi:hypothetical protein
MLKRSGSASFCQIRIGIGYQGIPIRIRIGVNARHMEKVITIPTFYFPQNSKAVKILEFMTL